MKLYGKEWLTAICPTISSDTPLLFQISPYGDSTNEFLIYTVYNNKVYYLNDKSNAGNRVQVYPSSSPIEGNNKNPNRWQFYDYSDIIVTTSSSNIKVATATGNGNFLSSLTWNGTIPNFPELSLSSDLTEAMF